jgi:hypothetical protein
LIGSVNLVNRVITDSRVGEETVGKFRERGIEVVIV